MAEEEELLLAEGAVEAEPLMCTAVEGVVVEEEDIEEEEEEDVEVEVAQQDQDLQFFTVLEVKVEKVL